MVITLKINSNKNLWLKVSAAFDSTSFKHFWELFHFEGMWLCKKVISFYDPKFEFDKRYCQLCVSDCLFLLGIVLPAWTYSLQTLDKLYCMIYIFWRKNNQTVKKIHVHCPEIQWVNFALLAVLFPRSICICIFFLFHKPLSFFFFFLHYSVFFYIRLLSQHFYLSVKRSTDKKILHLF